MIHKPESWMGMCLRYADYCTDAPVEFAEVMALQVLGFALGPDVVHRIQPEAVRHNSYVAFVGPSTFARKNTVQRLLGEDLVDRQFHLPQAGSPEAFLEELSEHNSGFQFMGEWSRELKGIKSEGYMASFAEIKNDLFDVKPYRKKLTSKHGKGEVRREFVIEKPYLCINTTCTEEVLRETLTTEMAEGGYFARFIVVGGKLRTRPRGRLYEDADSIRDMLKRIVDMVMRLDKSGCCFEMTDEALQYYNEVVEKEALSERYSRVRANAGRCLNYVVAFADCLVVSEAIGEWLAGTEANKLVELVDLVGLVKLVDNKYRNNSIKGFNSTNLTNSINPLPKNERGETVLLVQKHHVMEAWRILKNCLEKACEIVEYVDMGKPMARVTTYLRKHAGEGVPHSRALQYTNLTAKQFSEAIDTLKERGEVEVEEERFLNKRGIQCVRYYYKWVGGEKS